MIEILIDTLRNSILVTGLVVVMMMMIESLNIESGGRAFSRLRKSRFGQVVVASLLGAVPGCMGGFATVSLYTHGMFSFGALIAMMIASSGDEAFVMLAMFPQKALMLFGILFVLAIVTGWLTDLAGDALRKKKGTGAEPVPAAGKICEDGYEIHSEEEEHTRSRHFGWKRAVILSGTLIFTLALAFGYLEHDHGAHGHDGHDHGDAAECIRADAHEEQDHAVEINLLDEGWMNILFACLSVIMIGVIAFASDHFIDEHLWHHIICRHLPSIFLWTFGVLAAIGILTHFIDIRSWISDNTALMILLAVAVGIIPESGPHLIFVTLYASGILPFPVLLANSISQDGHAALPLLAETKRGFIEAKLINCGVALVCGYAAMLLGGI